MVILLKFGNWTRLRTSRKFPRVQVGDFGYVVAQPIAEADVQPGPSRLRGVLPPTVQPEVDFLEDSHLYF